MAQPSETSSLLPSPAQNKRESVEKILAGNVLEAQDPDQLELPKEDAQEPFEEQKTILRPEIERALSSDQPETLTWLQSLQGLMASYGIVLVAVLLNIYELVLKPKADTAGHLSSYNYVWQQKMIVGDTQANIEALAANGGKPWPLYVTDREDPLFGTPIGSWQFSEKGELGAWTYDFAQIPFWNAVLSIIVGLVLAAKNRKLGFVFSMESAKMCLIFQPAAVGFALSQFLGFFNLNFLAPDVMKVLDQSRLLVTAIVMMFLLSKSYSRATWNSLIVISLAAVIYGNVQTLIGSGGGASGNLPMGMLFVLLNATVTALAGVWAEKYMKAYKSTPFYIQKMYLEIGNFFVQLLFLFVITPLMYPKKLNTMASGNFNFNLFHGLFSNPYMMLLLWVFFIKNYMQGILVKRMSSLVKQLSAVVATALCYFFLIVHKNGCEPATATKVNTKESWKNDFANNHFEGFSNAFAAKHGAGDAITKVEVKGGLDGRRSTWFGAALDKDGNPIFKNAFKEGVAQEEQEQTKATMSLGPNIDGTKHAWHKDLVSESTSFFCFRTAVSPYMVIADLLVLFSVVSYIFSNRDKTRKTMYRKERDAAQGVKAI